ncbi:MAG: histidine phosphatase family protein [Lachnospiraceae bacterium]|nr:histidine phosphatase family protein [Lachnospiraceae bacterium]
MEKEIMKIFVLRHGDTDMNAKGVMQGWMDEPLNESGRELAKMTGQGMHGIRFDYCISSPLKRAVETARIVLSESGNDIEITMDERLKEIRFGDLEGKSLSELGDTARLFFTDPFHFPGAPNGETIRQLCERTQPFLKELIAKDDGKTYLISTHGCALRAMLNYLYDDPSDYWRGHAPYNCSVNIIEVKNGQAHINAIDKVYYDPSLIVDHYGNK